MTHQPDERIDLALHSLRDTQPPSGLEARVAARLAQAAEARATTETRSAAFSPFAVLLTLSLPKGKNPRILLTPAPLYTVAATALLAIVSLLTLHHHRPKIVSTASSNNATQTIVQQPRKYDCFEGAGLQFRRKTKNCNAALAAEGNARPAYKLTPKVDTPESLTDLDTLALAETLAPSRPAPPMPLTAQEHLLALAARQGQPMELAELETLRKPALEAAAEAHQNAAIRRYAQRLLAPLAAAEALNPTSPSPDDTSTPQSPSSK